jgi:hypothetical protein
MRERVPYAPIENEETEVSSRREQTTSTAQQVVGS